MSVLTATKKTQPVPAPDGDRRMPLPRGYDPASCLVLSATQLDMFWGSRESCNRKWWFRYVQKMPIVQASYQAFGTCLHSVCERFLRADDLGRDTTGLPVDLYPEGWSSGVPPIEADLIRRLVDRAIGDGMLARLPGRQVEHGFIRPLVDLESPVGMTHVFVQGWIDLLLPDEVQDHKTIAALKWAKSPASLQTNVQMLVYAHECLELARERGEELDYVTVGHNVFGKDPAHPAIRTVRTKISALEIDASWVTLKDVAANMVLLKQGYGDLDNWRQVPGPLEPAAACNAYKGCPFQRVCAGPDQPKDYKVRVERFLAEAATKTKETRSMSFADKVKEKNVKAPPAAAPGTMTINPPKNGVPKAPPKAGPPKAPPKQEKKWWHQKDGAAAPALHTESEIRVYGAAQDEDFYLCAEGSEDWELASLLGLWSENGINPAAQALVDAAPAAGPAPPWARANCPACKGVGFNSKGGPCNICNTSNRKEGKVTSDSFTIDTDGEGNVTWAPKETPEEPAKTPIAAAQPEKVPTSKTVEESPTEEELEAAVTNGKTKRGPGRPKAGFTLCVGCAPSKAGKIVLIEELLFSMGRELAGDGKSYYALNAFDRRDRLAQRAGELASTFAGGTFVVAFGKSPDVAALLDALVPHASEVIRAI